MSDLKFPDASAQQVVYVQQPAGAWQRDEEIDLGALFAILWQGRKLILGITAVFALLAVVYVKVLSSPVYEARIPLRPVEEAELASIQPLLLSENESTSLYFSAQELKLDVWAALQSYIWQQKFFAEKGLRENYLQAIGDKDSDTPELSAIKAFRGGMAFQAENSKKNLPAYLIFTSKHPENEFPFYSQFVQGVVREVMAEHASKRFEAIGVLRQEALDKIAYLRKSTRQALEDKKVRIREALAIASAMNIRDVQIDKLANVGSEASIVKDWELENVRYLLGSQALQAELNSLESRTNLDAYIPEIRELNSYVEQLDRYKKVLESRVAKVEAVRFPGQIEIPLEPKKSKGMLILAMSVILGAMLAVLIVFIRHAIRKNSGAQQTNPVI